MHAPTWLKYVLQTGALSLGFFAIGMLTRIPALAFEGPYALHALLAAPFYACFVSGCLKVFNKPHPILVASLVYALFLGSMQFVMGASVVVSTTVSLLVFCVTGNVSAEKRALVTGSVFGLAAYPATLIAGFLWGSFYLLVSPENVLQVCLLVLLSSTLSFLGALAGSSFRHPKKLGSHASAVYKTTDADCDGTVLATIDSVRKN